ncbi:MAG TPA: class I SAM-dependent methyltransferase [Bryobacteraceae bacterium]|nr:class I SAM-dependent methyltransferase [Bryobacteraceae bacterium]
MLNRGKYHRDKYQGVRQIFAYNQTFYLGTLAALSGVLAIVFWLPPLLKTIAIFFLVGTTFWTLSSLAVSHWIYDRSPLYSLDWLAILPCTWLNVHAGLDEMTALFRMKFPAASYRVFDIFDATEMTEPSIARVRALSGDTGQRASWKQLPASGDAFEAIFLPFVAHEFRRTQARNIFFRELARVLAPEGKIILVEHLRDLPNFLAFGPGFLHFQSRRAWAAAFRVANLRVTQEFSITPFVRVFEIERNG